MPEPATAGRGAGLPLRRTRGNCGLRGPSSLEFPKDRGERNFVGIRQKRGPSPCPSSTATVAVQPTCVICRAAGSVVTLGTRRGRDRCVYQWHRAAPGCSRSRCRQNPHGPGTTTDGFTPKASRDAWYRCSKNHTTPLAGEHAQVSMSPKTKSKQMFVLTPVYSCVLPENRMLTPNADAPVLFDRAGKRSRCPVSLRTTC